MGPVLMAQPNPGHNKQVAVAKVPHGGDFLEGRLNASVGVFLMRREYRNLPQVADDDRRGNESEAEPLSLSPSSPSIEITRSVAAT